LRRGVAPRILPTAGNLAVRQMARSCLFNILRYPDSGDENADKESMGSISSINNLSSSYLQSILSSALQNTSSTGSSSSSTGTSSVTAQSENGQLSPFAQLMSTLQQLQQSNPTEYKQVTQQIATNLQNAAKTATADGNSTQATQLNQLATDFTSASQSGQLPNMQDLAQAVGGGHHHHHAHAASSDADSSSSSTSSNSSTSQLSQLLAAFQANSTPNESLDPMAIITNTLSNAGINISNS
jgi:hypothetical protein